MREVRVKQHLDRLAGVEQGNDPEAAEALREASRMIAFYSDGLGCVLVQEGGSYTYTGEAHAEYREREENLEFHRSGDQGGQQTITLRDREESR